jgi:hypothetical protein
MKRNIGLTQAGIFDDVGDRPTLQPKTRQNTQSIWFSKNFQNFAKVIDIFFIVCGNTHMRMRS